MTIEVYEQNIPTSQRVLNGQYYTPASVCDLMLALTLQSSQPFAQRMLEPSCGVGAFLARGLDRFHNFTRSHSACRKPWPQSTQFIGIELDPQAAALAQQTLQQRDANIQLHIHNQDFLSSMVDTLGNFDVIIGNPPYVRQEHIAQSTALNKQAAIQQLQKKYEHYLETYPEQKILFNQTADLYIWFFLQATTLLKPGGKLTFITSNSWLNASYGQAFRQFLLHHFHIRYLVESACERWFKDAAINSIITVLEKRNDLPKHESENNHNPAPPIQVIRFQQPLEQWLPASNSTDYWAQLDHQIEQIATNAEIEYQCLSVEQLQSSGISNNWALPIRAPQSISTLLGLNDLWLRLDQLGTVRYPIKTGINRFFYLSRKQAEQWKIEEEFLFPVIRSAKKVKHYIIHEAACDEFLFACSQTLEQLAQANKTGAFAYITWGSTQTSPPRQKRGQPTLWPQIPSVQSSQRPWHALSPLPPAHLLCNRFIDRRFFFALCQGNLMEDQTFYGLTLSDPKTHPPELMGALLNCTLSYLLLELNGRTSLGEGVLQFARCDMAAFPVLNPNLFSPAEREALIHAFQRMTQRPILSMPDELQLEDRITLDKIVLGSLTRHLKINTSVLEFREQIVAPLLTRISERQTLARCFRQKTEPI